MLGTMRLSIRMLRRHMALYSGCMATVGATSVIASAQVYLVAGFSDAERVSVSSMSAEEVASQLTAIRGILSLLSGIAIVASGFLMSSAVKQVISFRQKEFALMRLVGATRFRISRMVFSECLLMALVVALPCSVVGALLSPALLAGLRMIGFFGNDVSVSFVLTAVPIVVVAVSMSLVAGLSGWVAARGATRGDLVHADVSLAGKLSVWQIAWRVTFGLAGLACIVLLDAQTLGSNLVLALPFLAVVPLFALAPVAIPAGASAVGLLVGQVAPGPGLLAAQRASRDRLRLARSAVPAIVCVGVLGGFLVANSPDEEARTAYASSRVGATAIARVTGIDDADRVAELPPSSVGATARFASRKNMVKAGDKEASRRTMYFTDSGALRELLHQNVVEGDAEKVKGTDIASSISGAHVGDSVRAQSASGRQIELHVVAVIKDPLYDGGIFLDWGQASQFVTDPTSLSATIFTTAVDDTDLRTAMSTAGIKGSVTDKSGYIEYLAETRHANTYRSNIGIFGTIYVMSLISLIQSAIGSNLARKREYRLLRVLGVSPKGILATTATETVIVQIVSGILIGITLVVLAVRFAALNSTSPLSALASAAPPTVAAYMSVLVLALASQLAGTYLTLRRSSRAKTRNARVEKDVST